MMVFKDLLFTRNKNMAMLVDAAAVNRIESGKRPLELALWKGINIHGIVSEIGNIQQCALLGIRGHPRLRRGLHALRGYGAGRA
jgi:hypothetical protein